MSDDTLAIRELVDNWVVWRDAGDWERFATVPVGTIAIDNAISHAAELTEFNRLLESDRGLTSALVPTGAGLIVAVAAG